MASHVCWQYSMKGLEQIHKICIAVQFFQSSNKSNQRDRSVLFLSTWPLEMLIGFEFVHVLLFSVPVTPS